MEIKIKISDAETLKELHGLSVDAYCEAWGEAILRLAQEHARSKLGGNFGKRIAKSVTVVGSGLKLDVDTEHGPEGYIGDAVEQGGTFRARSGKALAIPISPRTKKGGEFSGMFPSVIGRKVPLFMLKSKRGNRLLFERPEKGQELGGPLFVLKPSTQHKPRPWWPEEREIDAETTRFFDDNF